MLESIVTRGWIHMVAQAKLFEISKALKLGSVDDPVANVWELEVRMNHVVEYLVTPSYEHKGKESFYTK